MSTFFPTNMGYTPTGGGYIPPNGKAQSTICFGRTITGRYEGAGFGQSTRPDPLQGFAINFTDPKDPTNLIQRGSITLYVDDIISLIIKDGKNFPANLNLTLKEVLVCDAGVTKNMVIIGSQTYPTGFAA